jgi:hypothetical protein
MTDPDDEYELSDANYFTYGLYACIGIASIATFITYIIVQLGG